DDVHLGARLLERDAGLQPADRTHPVKVARHVRGLEGKRLDDLYGAAVQAVAFVEHAHDLVRLAVENDVAAYDRGIRAETALPKPIAQQYHVFLADLVLVRLELAPEKQLRAVDL